MTIGVSQITLFVSLTEGIRTPKLRTTYLIPAARILDVMAQITGEYGGENIKYDRLLPVLYWEDADHPGKVWKLQAYARPSSDGNIFPGKRLLSFSGKVFSCVMKLF